MKNPALSRWGASAAVALSSQYDGSNCNAIAKNLAAGNIIGTQAPWTLTH